MNKLQTLMQLANMLNDGSENPVGHEKEHAIVVADRGHVWVGQTRIDDEWVYIEGARIIRRWGTSEGLNELANKGPLSETKLDAPCSLRIPRRALIAIIPTEARLWS